jgi:hypothetical protein
MGLFFMQMVRGDNQEDLIIMHKYVLGFKGRG